MGYDTSYKLSWEKKPVTETKEWTELVTEIGKEKAEDLHKRGLIMVVKHASQDTEIADWIRSNDNANYALQTNGERREPCKWYDHVDDVKALSKKFPDTLFTLEGEGEEKEDMWRKYFLNGQVEVCRAVITYPPCTLRRP